MLRRSRGRKAYYFSEEQPSDTEIGKRSERHDKYSLDI